MTDISQKKRWGADRRLEFIDFRLYWEGRIRRSDLTEFFGISVPQASLDLARYQALVPGNVSYDGSEKYYVSTDEFRPALISPLSNSYLSELLSVAMELRSKDESFIGWFPDVGMVPLSKRWIDPTVLAQVLKAIRFNHDLQINYQSMTRGESAVRWLSPHALGFDGFRWHIRAYCHTRSGFRDFLFSRISSITSERQSTTDRSLDTAWNHNVVVKIGPHPLLSDAQRRAVEIDYEMTSGVASIETRVTLLFYLLRRLGLLDAIQEQRPPETQHIVLLNRQEVEAALRENEPAS
jgi:hypothetical protein